MPPTMANDKHPPSRGFIKESHGGVLELFLLLENTTSTQDNGNKGQILEMLPIQLSLSVIVPSSELYFPFPYIRSKNLKKNT